MVVIPSRQKWIHAFKSGKMSKTEKETSENARRKEVNRQAEILSKAAGMSYEDARKALSENMNPYDIILP